MNKSFTETINWVSVDERMPDTFGRATYLVRRRGGTVFVDYSEHRKQYQPTVPITHWAEWPKGEVK